MSFISTLSTGKRYMQTWPMLYSLSSIFPENRVILATTKGLKIAPVAALLYVSSVALLTPNQLPMAMAVGLFLVSLPIQGLYWLGERAKRPLSASLLAWCQEIIFALEEHQIEYAKNSVTPNYLGMAKLLFVAVEKLPEKAITQLLNR